MTSRLFEKVYGCLMGAAVGDAMGAPVEGMHYRDICEQFSWVKGFQEPGPRMMGGRSPYEQVGFWHDWHERREIPVGEPHPFGAWRLKAGVYTDDMRFRLLALQSYIKRRGQLTGWEFAEDVIEYRIECARFPPDDPHHRWAKGMFNIDEIVTMCLKNPIGSTLLVGGIWGMPAGLIHACDPHAAAEDGGLIAAIVARAMYPDATVDDVIQAAFDFAQSIPSADYDTLPTWGDVFSVRLEQALKCADESSDVFELIARLYEWLCATVPPFSIQNVFEAVPVALAMIHKANGDFRQAVIGAVNYGRDCDTSAGVAGEILGALHGISAVPSDWVTVINRENPCPDLEEVASQVVDVLAEKAGQAERIAATVMGMSQ